MKSILTIIALCAFGTLFAQVKYESGYVYEGKSFQFGIPSGYTFLAEIEEEALFYSKDSKFDVRGEGTPEDNCILIGVASKAETGFSEDDGDVRELLIRALILDFDQSEEEIADPVSHKTSKGYEFILGEMYSDFEGMTETPVSIKVGIGEFEEVFILCLWFDISGTENSSEFETLIEAYSEFETDRESTYIPAEPEEYNEYYESYFENIFFETTLSYEIIDFEIFSEETEESFNWYEIPGDEYPELLTGFSYEYETEEGELVIEGGVKVFSAGALSDYATEEEQFNAFKKNFSEYDIKQLNGKTTIETGTHTFQRYVVISNEGDASYPMFAYALEQSGELVYFMIHGTDQTTEEFPAIAERLITSVLFYEF